MEPSEARTGKNALGQEETFYVTNVCWFPTEYSNTLSAAVEWWKQMEDKFNIIILYVW